LDPVFIAVLKGIIALYIVLVIFFTYFFIVQAISGLANSLGLNIVAVQLAEIVPA